MTGPGTPPHEEEESIEDHLWRVHHFASRGWPDLSREVWHVELHIRESTAIEPEWRNR
jgi:hypothetical protein